MGIVSYAQNFEDVMLWRALGHVPQGFYIDIGAQDPVVDSVSLAFYERGWRGIHVEATPAYAEKIRQARPDELVLQVAVGDRHGVANFFEIPGTGISTGDKSIADTHLAKGFEVRRITVPCITLEDILEQANVQDIHWLKIDVEGMEASVLKSWGKSRLLPWIVVVESTLPLTQVENHLQWEAHLLKRGYQAVYFDGLNRYYVSPRHPELIEAFGSGPNVFDGFTLNGTASAPFCAGIVQASSQKEAEFRQELDRLQQEHQQAIQAGSSLLSELERKNEEQSVHISRLRDQLSDDLTNHVERERFLLAQVQSLQQQTQTVQTEVANRERALRNLAEETVRRAQDEAQDHLKELVRRERGYSQELQSVREELSRLQQNLLDQQQIAQKERDELLQEGGARERALQGLVQETYRRGLAEARVHLQSVAQREQEVSRERLALHQQMQGLQQAAQREKEQFEQASRREQEVSRELQALHQQLEGLQQVAQREKEQFEQASRREQEVSRELQALHQQLEGLQQASQRDKEQFEQVSRREQEVSRELQVLRQQMQGLQQAAQREREQLEQAARKERDASERERLALREEANRQREALQREAGARERALQTLVQDTHRRGQEEAQLHLEAAVLREQEHSRRQQALQQQMLRMQQAATRERERLQEEARRQQERLQQAARLEKEELQRNYSLRERELEGLVQETYRQGQVELQSRLADIAQREREYSRELQSLQHKMLRLQQEAAQREHDILAQAAKALDEVREEARHHLENLAQREREYAQELHAIQQRTLQAQQEASERQQEIETRLQAEIAAERQVAEQLRTSLAETQHLLSLTHASLSWRFTAPFRRLARIFRHSGDPPDDLANLSGDSVPMVAACPIPRINPITQPVSTTVMLIDNSTTSPASTLEELLGLHDRHFVDCAYKTLLGRPVDADGLAYYLGRLHAGFPKIGLLGQLRLSAEGQSHGAEVAGLDKAIQQYRRGQLPVVGWFFRWLESTEGRQPFECRLRSIEGQLQVLSEDSRQRFDLLTKALEDIRDQISSSRPVPAVSGQAPVAESKPVPPPVQKEDLGHVSPRVRDIYLKLAQG